MRSLIIGLYSVIWIQNAWCEISNDCLSCGNVQSYLDDATDLIEKAKISSSTCPTKSEYKPKDCADVIHEGHYTSGVYTVWPMNRLLDDTPINVFCDMETEEGGWTVIQRRGNFNRSKDYFYKDWNSYKKGFGDILKDFWLGNDNIFSLTNQRFYSIRIDMKDVAGQKVFALYDAFWIDDEINKYRLHIQDYSGNAGDSLIHHHNNQFFSTKDRKNDHSRARSCAQVYKGGWWFNDCHHSNLNGLYLRGKHASYADGVNWLTWKGYQESLDTTEMKIRPKNFRIASILEATKNY